MKKISITLLWLIILIAFSCKHGKEFKTENGFKYILYTDSKGPKAKIGDYITMSMVYKNSNDSILFDSRINGSPIRFRLEKIPFKGSFEDGLTNLSADDSATFFVPADSLYSYLNKSRGTSLNMQKDEVFIPGSFLKFEIKLLKIQSEADAEEEMVMELSQREKQGKIDMLNYIEKRKITITPDESGYYLLMKEKGNGSAIDSGKVVTLEYEGRFLNDSVFDGTKKAGQPYKFISGAHHVISGWEIAMKTLNAGDKFTLILPSKLAYGEEGIRDTKSGMFIVPPYTPLVFDINVISVEDVPAVSRK